MQPAIARRESIGFCGRVTALLLASVPLAAVAACSGGDGASAGTSASGGAEALGVGVGGGLAGGAGAAGGTGGGASGGGVSGGASGNGGAPLATGGTLGSGNASGSGGASSGDSGSVASGGASVIPGADAGSGSCTVTDTAALCSTRPIVTVTNGGDTRRVYWNTPAGAPPASGFPVVVLFQGSLYGPSTSWDVSLPKTTAFGGYYQVVLIARLLARGFTVVQPEAQGGLAWNTNAGNYDTSPDSVFIPQLLGAIKAGTYGPTDMSHLYATGISSGGYMTSRMAVSYPGKFRALAIQSGSYATCLGPFCTVPAALPADHPPTLFLHGGADTTVPIGTAKDYYQKLVTAGIQTKFVEDPSAGHQWLSTAPEDVTDWLTTH